MAKSSVKCTIYTTFGKIFWGILQEVIYGAPAKIFAKQKDLWGKEEQALKTRCLPSGKYPKRALKMGPPQRFLRSKKICGERRNRRYKRGVRRQADARKRRRVPTWCRRPASNRYAFRHRILNPARLPISPRRHIRRPLRDGAQFFCLGTQFSSGPFGSGSPPSAGALSCSVSSASVLASSAFSTGAGVPSGAAYACVLTVRS